MAFSMYAGAEMIFPSFWLYRATVIVLAAACFAVTEVGIRRLLHARYFAGQRALHP